MTPRRAVPSAGLSTGEWMRLRGVQASGEPSDAALGGRFALNDELSPADWQWLRDAQVRGLVPPSLHPVRMEASSASQPRAEAAGAAVTAPRRPVTANPVPPKGPLTGRPGTAAFVAGALNTIASGPNTSARIDNIKHIDGTVTRGAGRDVSAEGRAYGREVGAQGALDPPTGRAEVSASAIKGRGIGLPPRVRFYTTPTGELDVELSGPITLGRIPFVSKGTYVIGEPDPPSRRR